MKKNNLDERQEQKLQTSESRGFWLAFWLLVISLAVQFALNCDGSQLAGEAVVLTIIAFYSVIGSIHIGVWDRHAKPTFKQNLFFALAGGLGLGVAMTIRVAIRSGDVLQGAMFGVVYGGFTFIASVIALWITSYIYKKKENQLEQETENPDKPHL